MRIFIDTMPKKLHLKLFWKHSHRIKQLKGFKLPSFIERHTICGNLNAFFYFHWKIIVSMFLGDTYTYGTGCIAIGRGVALWQQSLSSNPVFGQNSISASLRHLNDELKKKVNGCGSFKFVCEMLTLTFFKTSCSGCIDFIYQSTLS